LKNNLQSKGIKWPLIESQNPHIVYASIPSNWELENIPQSLKKISNNVSFYYTIEHKINFSNNRKKSIKENDKIFYNWVIKLNHIKKIDIIITYFSGGEISSTTIDKIKKLKIPIFTFHLDDRLHFFGRLIGCKFSGPYSVCKSYDLNLSSSIYSLNQYKYFNSLVYYWPEGANPDFFKPIPNTKKKYDVVFVGSKYGIRSQLIKYLINKGIKVTCFGKGWENGSLSSSDYIKVINESNIVLGLGYISFTKKQTLKGRDFEIPSCGALYLTTYNKELDYLFELNSDIITYNNFSDCVNKINYYLNNPIEVEKIKNNARKKILNKHSWESRFREILFNEYL
jgi:spore maturation protein CgeB